VAVQVNEHLRVWVAVGKVVRGVHREGGFADASHAVDGLDHHRRGRDVPLAREGGQQSGHLLPAAGEVGDVTGQITTATVPRHRWCGQSRVTAQDLFVHCAQFWPWIHS
jgi:hypothetical protein